MPLVAYTPLPTFARLLDEQHDVLSVERASHQDIRELHIGLLNMMPDASLKATERQFMRLVGDSNQIVQFYVHLFTIPAIERSPQTQAWIDDYYEDFASIKAHGLDALIISGANPKTDSLEKEAFWPMLTEVIDWAKEHVTSTLCACLATHAVVQYLYDIQRQPLERKRWGVYQHRLTNHQHPLTRHMNSRFDVPHSRYNQVSAEQLETKGLKVLAYSQQADVHLAVSEDGIRLVFFQGHPEYDVFSLLKEYKREIDRWFNGVRPDYPPFPESYFEPELKVKLVRYKRLLERARQDNAERPIWPEADIKCCLDNTWRDTALSTFNNWLGIVYRLTNTDPKLPFMAGIDPDRPLESLSQEKLIAPAAIQS